MSGPELALAASARDWPDRLHRFLLDHGGGRVRARVMGPEQAMADSYHVLLVDDICSFLTPRLVRRLRESGRQVLGVYAPSDGPDAKRRLLECGITDMIEAEATPEEYVAAVRAMLEQTGDTVPVHRSTPGSVRVGVVGAGGGTGVTEVSAALAMELARRQRTVLVDLDQTWPGIAQRLDLPLHPNLRTAVDIAHHSHRRLDDAIQRVGGLDVVGGLANPGGGNAVPPAEVRALLEELASAGRRYIVADLGTTRGGDELRLRFQVVIVVGRASPLGLTRLVRVNQALASDLEGVDVVAAVNRTPISSRMRAEIRSEVASALPGRPVVLLPEDRRLARAGWDGRSSFRGTFVKSVMSMAGLIDKALAS